MSRDTVVRPRRDTDLDTLDALATTVRALDGYPPDSPELFPPAPAFVAVRGERMVGHVALHERSAEEVMALASRVLGRPAGALIVVSRLLVAPDARRQGVARRLLATAVDGAHERDRWPVLDVSTSFAPAIALYESAGWSRAGEVSFPFRDGVRERRAWSFVYVGPAPADR